jgi:hypothetical protein
MHRMFVPVSPPPIQVDRLLESDLPAYLPFDLPSA